MLATSRKGGMTDVGDDDTRHTETLDAMYRAGFTMREVWVYHVSMGGNMSEFEVNAYLHGLVQLPTIDRDMLSRSVNDHIAFLQASRINALHDSPPSPPPAATQQSALTARCSGTPNLSAHLKLDETHLGLGARSLK